MPKGFHIVCQFPVHSIQEITQEGIFMVCVVKWIPKDQDVTIDRTKRYADPTEALEFACNAIRLNPKRIWIEDERGVLHTEHEIVLARAQARQHGNSNQ